MASADRRPESQHAIGLARRPMVSIIIIFLNVERFLEEAVQSVLGQTFKDWELLLVDDGSTDSSTHVAQQCAARSPSQVRYLEHESHRNRGMSASRNLGISHAKGRHIAFLDADDIWLPQKLDRQVAILDSQPEAAMVCGPSQYWFSWTGKPEDLNRDFVNHLRVPSDTLLPPSTLLTLSLEGKANTPCPSNILLRRDIVERVGGFEEEFTGMYGMYEDQAFLAKVTLNAPIFVSGECWDRYRKHPDSCVAVMKRAGQSHHARLYFLSWLAMYLSEHGITHPVLWEALNTQLWPYRHPVLDRLQRHADASVVGMKELAKRLLRGSLPGPARRWLRARWQSQ